MDKARQHGIQLHVWPLIAFVVRDPDELDESDREETEELDATAAVREIAPMYLKPRAPSIKDDEDGEFDDVPLSAHYLRSKMAGRCVFIAFTLQRLLVRIS